MSCPESTHSPCDTFPFRKDAGKWKVVKKHSLTFVRKQDKSLLMRTPDVKWWVWRALPWGARTAELEKWAHRGVRFPQEASECLSALGRTHLAVLFDPKLFFHKDKAVKEPINLSIKTMVITWCPISHITWCPILSAGLQAGCLGVRMHSSEAEFEVLLPGSCLPYTFLSLKCWQWYSNVLIKYMFLGKPMVRLCLV